MVEICTDLHSLSRQLVSPMTHVGFSTVVILMRPPFFIFILHGNLTNIVSVTGHKGWTKPIIYGCRNGRSRQALHATSTTAAGGSVDNSPNFTESNMLIKKVLSVRIPEIWSL